MVFLKKRLHYTVILAVMAFLLSACGTTSVPSGETPSSAHTSQESVVSQSGSSTFSEESQSTERSASGSENDSTTADTARSTLAQETISISPSSSVNRSQSLHENSNVSTTTTTIRRTTAKAETAVTEQTTRKTTTGQTTRQTYAQTTGQSASRTTTTTRATTATQPDAAEDYRHAILRLVNQERTKAGLTALVLDDTVSRAAQIRAVEIIESFSHTRPDGTSCFTALDEVGIISSRVARAENIAAGQQSPEDVMKGWMNSDGHRANILNPSLKKLGVGYAEGGRYRTNWVQMFTS